MNALRRAPLGYALLGAGLLAALLAAPGLTGTPPLLALALGIGAWPLAAALLGGGTILALSQKPFPAPRWRTVAWAELIFLLALGLAHTFQPVGEDAALAGRGGGLAGWGIAFLPVYLAGSSAARFVLALAIAASTWMLWRSLPPASTARILATLRSRFARPFISATSVRANTWARGARAAGSQAGTDLRAVLARFGRWLTGASHTTPQAAPLPVPPPQPLPPPRPRRKKASGERPAQRPADLPAYDILHCESSAGGVNADSRHRAQMIVQTLGEFGIPVEVVSIKEGPTVTQFGLEPGEVVRELRGGEIVRRRVSVQSILRLNNDLALALAAPSLRIEAPVPGRPYIGIEVPNPGKSLVCLRNILESKEFAATKSSLAVALGRDVAGDPAIADLTRMPHLLIAGATGSGKSVCINAVICSLLMNNAPENVRLLMVDPKMVELPAYNGIPHLVGPVITDPQQATGALAWLTLQMDDRYRLFADHGVRNIADYNHKAGRSRELEPLPYLVLVIDELADLMMTAAVEIERQVCRLAQLARATGIHLVLATQRPSVDVITGLIKANFPARIAFAVTSQIDSRVVLDTPGAEKLLGRGDMLFMAPDSARLQRIQGCFVSEAEMERVVDYWQARAAQSGDAPAPVRWEGLVAQADAHDALLDQALRLIETRSHVSTSLLQRQLRIGHPRAARLMDQLEEMGVVGSEEVGGRSREVLMREETATAELERSL